MFTTTRKEKRTGALLRDLILAVSAAIAILLIILVFKVKGGFIGIALGTITIIALIYWLREVRRIFQQQENMYPAEHDWLYEFIEEGENLILVASVPGPSERVKIKIIDSFIEIRGGGNFVRRVQIPKDVRIVEKSYANGVLRVKLHKTAASNSQISSQKI
ncbi:Hsp20/alpha crystallin family protein [Candidatus Bathyarchaeota archaeon]|nr:Hsp20/alpha crystallin family protein [Candidatus Bathyarchaeota archaeon]